MKEVLKEAKERMGKSLESFEHNISVIRTGRANPAMLSRVQVDYYGAMTPLPQLASVSSPDPRTLHIVPFDKGALNEIEKAIRDSDLGFNPSNKGDSIFISVPPLNDERRHDLVKTVKNLAEEARVALRSIRRDANDELKEMHKEKTLSEDDLRHREGEVQKLTDEFSEKVEARLKAKEADILEV